MSWMARGCTQPSVHVDFTTVTPAGATEMLVRAKSVPLYLEAWFPKHECDWDRVRFSTFQKELQPRVSHISQLAISAQRFSLEWLLEGLVSPAPILRYLSLSGKKYRKRIFGQPLIPTVPVTLFDGSTPRLSRLELRHCDISWKSPLFRGLKHLKISRLSAGARPKLSFWLDALEETPQLKTLVLHSASPISSFPFEVKRTVTLPSLTYFDIYASPEDCGLALAHLVLPALTSLCVTAFSSHENRGDVQRMLPYVARHAHGPQDTWPLQSVLIHGNESRVNILAWLVPNIDVEVHDSPTLLATMLSPRVTLYITSNVWRSEIPFEILDAAMAALPLDGPVMPTAEHLDSDLGLRMVHFWLRCAPWWPLLRRVRLGCSTEKGFIKMLLEENGGG
ncbi:hypothetical protein EDB89DRAFT_1275393 [Lactarius sanguifluus]|nr:hypothetical protein EDB89DRAFT_1275393 [Lactarius sanguifluus]